MCEVTATVCRTTVTVVHLRVDVHFFESWMGMKKEVIPSYEVTIVTLVVLTIALLSNLSNSSLLNIASLLA